jgi:hypothetical protein
MVMGVKRWEADSDATRFYTPIGESTNRDNRSLLCVCYVGDIRSLLIVGNQKALLKLSFSKTL